MPSAIMANSPSPPLFRRKAPATATASNRKLPSTDIHILFEKLRRGHFLNSRELLFRRIPNAIIIAVTLPQAPSAHQNSNGRTTPKRGRASLTKSPLIITTNMPRPKLYSTLIEIVFGVMRRSLSSATPGKNTRLKKRGGFSHHHSTLCAKIAIRLLASNQQIKLMARPRALTFQDFLIQPFVLGECMQPA